MLKKKPAPPQNPQDAKPQPESGTYWKGYIAAFASGAIAGDLVVGAEVSYFILRAFKIVQGGTAVVISGWSAVPALIGSFIGMFLYHAGKFLHGQYKSQKEMKRLKEEQDRQMQRFYSQRIEFV